MQNGQNFADQAGFLIRFTPLLNLLSIPFRELLLQLLFVAGQVELVFAGVNVGVLKKGNLDQGGILFLAEHDADGVVLRLGSDVAVKIVDVPLLSGLLQVCRSQAARYVQFMEIYGYPRFELRAAYLRCFRDLGNAEYAFQVFELLATKPEVLLAAARGMGPSSRKFPAPS